MLHRSILAFFILSGPAAAQSVVTVAGTGEKGFSGDGGPAAKARLNNPYSVRRGPDGLLYICDMDNNGIRRIAKDGTISTFVGNGKRGYSGDGGPAKDASLNQPYDLAWDQAGHLYFVEIGNHVVRRVDAKTGVISTVAGTGKAGFGGDGGPAAKALLNQPHSLATRPAISSSATSLIIAFAGSI
jgi:streptogramin lyase